MVYAILIHALLDFTAVYLQLNGVDIMIIELIVAIFAVLGLIYTIFAKKRFKKLDDKAIIAQENPPQVEA